MSKVRNADKVKKYLMSKITEKMKDVSSDAAAYLFREILQGNPVEDGHAHEAWLSALEKIKSNLPDVSGVIGQFSSVRSGDATAKKYAQAQVKTDKSSTTVCVSNNLPFVRKIEYGMPITVGDDSGNKGAKINPVKRPPDKGPLYGKRASGSNGVLVFEQGGRTIKAKVYTSPNSGFVAEAIKKTMNYLKSKGFKVKRRSK